MDDRRDPVARWRDTEFGRKIRTTTREFARDGSLGIHTSITRGAAIVRK
jgi:hypothetical protein